jgi:hypothetical protein
MAQQAMNMGDDDDDDVDEDDSELMVGVYEGFVIREVILFHFSWSLPT